MFVNVLLAINPGPLLRVPFSFDLNAPGDRSNVHPATIIPGPVGRHTSTVYDQCAVVHCATRFKPTRLYLGVIRSLFGLADQNTVVREVLK